eukprot:TRINITY_DN27336_c0_g1_i1.p1 TRINITY_DN27336_c0_g1~~TRINITY_DN27336_c0_g1_i1.p1  ORF type:complete len:300 (+),score=33.38 TRINITY_DN27336_c0_g1_i1:12-911(+)
MAEISSEIIPKRPKITRKDVKAAGISSEDNTKASAAAKKSRRGSVPTKQRKRKGQQAPIKRMHSADESKASCRKAAPIPIPSTGRPSIIGRDVSKRAPVTKKTKRKERPSFGENIPEFTPESRSEWHDWLRNVDDDQDSVWLVYRKQDSQLPTVTYDEAVEEALMFGWIDGRAQSKDAQSYRQHYTRRNPKSGWSRVNKERVAKLEAEGRMQSSGQAAVAAAKANGAWNLLDDSENLVLHSDVEAALLENPKAHAHFNDFPAGCKRNILRWIYEAKRASTRAERLRKMVDQAELNLRVR